MPVQVPINWLKPKNDFMFKLLFGSESNQSKELLLAFLNDVLDVPEGQSLAVVEIQNPITNKTNIADKMVILDVKARAVGYGFVNVEIQLTNQKNIHKRSLYYGAKLYEEQLGEGEDYRKLTRVVTINLLDFSFFTTDCYRSSYRLMEESSFETFPDLIQLHFFEMPKFVKEFQENRLDPNDRMAKWLHFLTNEDDTRWEEMAEQEPILKKAVDILRAASLDPETRMQYEAREKALKDIVSIRGDGIEEGKIEGKIEMARNLLKEGVDIQIIMRTSGLSKEKIEKLAKELNC